MCAPYHLYKWLDVLDTDKMWLEAQIIGVHRIIDDEKSRSSTIIAIHIHYKGWKSRYDEWLVVTLGSSDLDRLAPFNSRTLCPNKTQRVIVPHALLTPGRRLDVQDCVDDWYEAEIIDIDNEHKMIQVKYKGWSSKCNEWLNEDSYRLAPLNTKAGNNKNKNNGVAVMSVRDDIIDIDAPAG